MGDVSNITRDTWMAAARKTSRCFFFASRLPKVINYLKLKNQPNLLFIWIPKNAGTSIAHWLHSECGMLKLKEPIAVRGGFPNTGAVTFGHMSVSHLVEAGIVKQEFVDKALVFAFSRNPYDRALSLYAYLSKRRRFKGSMTEFLESVGRDHQGVGLKHSSGLIQANPQVSWLRSSAGKLLTDRVWKMEEISVELSQICAELGVRNQPPTLNQSVRGDVKSLNNYDIKLINQLYSDDFDLLGYSRDPTKVFL